MNKKITGEKIVNLALFLVSVFYLTYSVTHYKLGTVRMPKEGFLPLVIGIGMTVISGWLMLKSFLNKGDAQGVTIGVPWLKFGALVVVSVLYALTLQTVGYMLGSFLFLLVVFKLAGVEGWVKPLVISLICAVGFYLVFKVALGVMLPRGFLPW